MRTKNLYFLILFLSMLFNLKAAFAQDSSIVEKSRAPKNLVYLELGGNAILYSVNYEKIISSRTNWMFTIRAGVGVFNDSYNHKIAVNYFVPVMVNALLGKRKSKLEVGLGMSPLINLDFEGRKNPVGDVPFIKFYQTTTIGYRYQPDKKGLLFKIAYTPYIYIDKFPYEIVESSIYRSWGGVSIGYAF
jgi:hypothetical protein